MEEIDNFIKNSCGYRGYENFEYSKSLKCCVVLEVKTGGHEGGSCYGTSSQAFSKNEDDQKNDFFDGLFYLKKFLHESFDIKEKTFDHWRERIYSQMQHSEIGSISSSSDYYGNGSDYNVYAIPLLKIFQDFQIDQPHVQYIIETSHFFDEEKEQEENIKKINILNQKIEIFDKEKQKEFKQLKNIRVQLIKQLEDNKLKIENFDTKKEKELSQLNLELLHLQKNNHYEKAKPKY